MAQRWHDDLTGCPSQCLLEVMGPHGIPYVLYLRWRHEDPWKAKFIRDATVEDMNAITDWSEDVFEKHHVRFSIEHPLEDVKARLLAIWQQAVEYGIVDAYFKELTT